MMTRILFRMLLIAALYPYGAAIFAGPPRFSTYKSSPNFASEQASQEPAASTENTEPETNQVDPEAVKTSSEPQTRLELVDGKLVNTEVDNSSSPDTANPSATTDKTATENATQTAADSGTDPVKVPGPEQTTKSKKRGPLLQLGKRKPIIPDEITYKQNEKLVTTSEYHESDIDKLGIADTHRYVPGLDERWKVNTSKVMCSMQQEIPGYGHVEFRQGVGQPLEFALYVTYPPAGIGRAHIRTEPPEWRHFSQAKDLGVIEIEPGDLAVSTSPDWANRLLLELREGMQPVLRYWDAADATDDMEVLISSLNFQQSLNLFNRCLGQVLRYDFDAVKRTIVHFHEDSSRLRTKSYAQLDEVLDILREDKKVKHIDLELYTHKQGLVRYNFRLATRRARAIRDYFMKHGVSEEDITIKIHTYKKAKLDEMGYKSSDVHVVLRRDKKSK